MGGGGGGRPAPPPSLILRKCVIHWIKPYGLSNTFKTHNYLRVMTKEKQTFVIQFQYVGSYLGQAVVTFIQQSYMLIN